MNLQVPRQNNQDANGGGGGLKRVGTSSELMKFKTLTQQNHSTELAKEMNALLLTAPESEKKEITKEFNGFQRLFEKYLVDQQNAIEWEKIEPLNSSSIIAYRDIAVNEKKYEKIREDLSKLVVIKLNGGLGTSMGCTGPKSSIVVRDNLTFLDLIIKQLTNINEAFNTNVPLVLMNSFNTHEETSQIINKYNHVKVQIHTFNQSRYPRIDRDKLLPVARNAAYGSNLSAWYPPGHGDLYESFYNSGLLEKFLAEGKEYTFVSNSDNLGAEIDLNILDFLVNPTPENTSTPEFVMEVTNKTRADVKGGTLINYEGHLRLLEIAQVAPDHVDEFKSVSKFKIFNTNNLWVSLKAMKRVIENRTIHMEIIVNNKHVNDTDVIQLETASGAAIKSFDGAIGINVPRSRFLPVKTTSDLMLIMSNLYTQKKGQLEMNTLRSFPTVPIVKLGSSHFAKVNNFLARFGNIPNCIELDHLTVSGDVTFGKNVTLRGTVIIIANHTDRIDIPQGAILENKIISGNMRIMDH